MTASVLRIGSAGGGGLPLGLSTRRVEGFLSGAPGFIAGDGVPGGVGVAASGPSVEGSVLSPSAVGSVGRPSSPSHSPSWVRLVLSVPTDEGSV